jgi:2-polyprenyl-3-methyl-5-hydroxy-6-metoxy-1,4-benzoquinol methylase
MKNFIKIIDLGFHPFADTFIKKNQLNKSEPVYSLACFLNKKNGSIQNLIKTNAKDRYNLYEYSYTSSNSKYSRQYWKDYSKEIINEISLNSNSKIVEIGSNDGYLLKCFRDTTKNLLGIDASKKMSDISKKINVKTLNLIFNTKTSKEIVKKNNYCDVVIANNVMNHSNDLSDFINGVKNILNKKGIFIFEVPYWYDLVLNRQFDQIYHEHIHYITIKSAFHALKLSNFEIFKIKKTKYHGGSIRVYAKISKSVQKLGIVTDYIETEKKLGLFKEKTYAHMMEDLNIKKINTINKIIKYKKKGFKIVGIGAAAKGNTFLNFIKADITLFDFVTDHSKLKINKYTPLSRIPIIPDEKLKDFKKIYAIILSWNIEKIIKKKLLNVNKNIKYFKFS